MNTKKNGDNSLNTQDIKNYNYLPNKSSLNSETNKINQNLLFFKNDILTDIRKVEERFNYKLIQQSVIISEQYDSFEKKLSELSAHITQVHQMIIDNNDLTEKIKTFLRFKTKTEDNIDKMNSKIEAFQKENSEFIINIEKLINDNLRYPGVIGKNAKFLNFRFFIDYILKNFNDLNEFRNEIRKFEFNEFKKKINSHISDFRFSISDNYRNSVRLISKNFKEFDTKVENLLERNNKIMKDNETKFEELKNNINKYFSDYQTKFETLEKNINEKYIQQLKEIDNIKNMKNEMTNDINNFKSFFENIKSSNSNINNNINSNERYNSFNENRNNYKSNENNNQIISSSDKKNKIIINDLISNNFDIINLSDKNKNIGDKYNKDHSLNNNILFDNSTSFQKMPEDKNFKTSNKNKDLSLTNYELRKQEEKKEFDSYYNAINKENRRNNYSITNIANIKIRKVILPEYISKRNIINKRNIKRTTNSSSSVNRGSILLSNNHSSYLQEKSYYCKDNSNYMRNIFFNLSKINRHKSKKNKNINLVKSAKLVNRKAEKNIKNKI